MTPVAARKRRTNKAKPTLVRQTFKTSRELDFFSEKELIAQTGHSRDEWPAVIVKELVDNAIDACEEHDIAPEIVVTADETGITVTDNGPGLQESTLEGVLDFDHRISSCAAYCSVTRGAQGNALKTLVGMPFVLDQEHGRLLVTARGFQYSIRYRIHPISQRLVPEVIKTKVSAADKGDGFYKLGTSVRVEWGKCTVPSSERRMRDAISSIECAYSGNPAEAASDDVEIGWPFGSYSIEVYRQQLVALARGYVLFNPHLSLRVDWFGETIAEWKAANTEWSKWRPNQPTSAHWYQQSHFERLIAANITHNHDAGIDRTIADFISEFDGLAGSRKRTAVLEQADVKRLHLSELATDSGLRSDVIERLLAAMKTHTKPVREKRLGKIGSEHMTARLVEFGCVPESIEYRVRKRCDDGIPFVLESVSGYLGGNALRQLYAGLNWSPGIKNPYRSFGATGEGLESLLEKQRAGRHEPIVFALHLAQPRVEYTDHGKSAISVEE